MPEELYAHQKYNDEKKCYENTFIVTHDDTFGREFRSLNELYEYFKDYDNEVTVKPLSRTKYGINIFLLIVCSDVSIEGTSELDQLCNCFCALDYVRYYTVLPCNYQPIEKEAQ